MSRDIVVVWLASLEFGNPPPWIALCGSCASNPVDCFSSTFSPSLIFGILLICGSSAASIGSTSFRPYPQPDTRSGGMDVGPGTLEGHLPPGMFRDVVGGWLVSLASEIPPPWIGVWLASLEPEIPPPCIALCGPRASNPATCLSGTFSISLIFGISRFLSSYSISSTGCTSVRPKPQPDACSDEIDAGRDALKKLGLGTLGATGAGFADFVASAVEGRGADLPR
jgi:hypothetical protein